VSPRMRTSVGRGGGLMKTVTNLWDSVICPEILEWLHNWRLLRKESATSSLLMYHNVPNFQFRKGQMKNSYRPSQPISRL
jgi:hypothetical protein